jgi:hypothetical protein
MWNKSKEISSTKSELVAKSNLDIELCVAVLDGNKCTCLLSFTFENTWG